MVAAGAKGPASPLELRGLWLQSTPTCVSFPWSGPGLAFVRISELGVEYKKPHALSLVVILKGFQFEDFKSL